MQEVCWTGTDSALLMIAGVYVMNRTEVDVFPDLNAPTVVVMTEAGGMAAEEVEQLVTFPIETAVNGATGVRRVRSSSTTGFSVVWVEFDWDMDIYLARQIVSEKIAMAAEELPENVGNPTLGPQSSILGELLIVGMTADSTSMLDLISPYRLEGSSRDFAKNPHGLTRIPAPLPKLP